MSYLENEFVLSKLRDKNIKSVLNIGFRHDSEKEILNFLHLNNKRFCVLEAWKENCEDIIKHNTCKKENVICGDCRQIDSVVEENFDAILWLHGPEHIKWDEFLITRDKIEKKANHLVVYEMPVGEYPQGALYNNPYEIHVQTLLPKMFEELNYKTYHFGSEFIAYVEK